MKFSDLKEKFQVLMEKNSENMSSMRIELSECKANRLKERPPIPFQQSQTDIFLSNKYHRPDTGLFREKAAKVFAPFFKTERKAVADTLESIIEAVRYEVDVRVLTGKKRLENTIFKEISDRQKEFKKLKELITTQKEHLKTSLSETEAQMTKKVETFLTEQELEREKLVENVLKDVQTGRDDIANLAFQVEEQVKKLKEQREIDSHDFFDELKNS